MLPRRLLFLCVVCLSVFAASLAAQSGTIRYIYDELGRLAGVIDGNGDAAVYHYDAVGNLLSITRSTSTQVEIIDFTPDSGPSGHSVTIYGTGFSATPGSNTVTFNGTSATVTTASTTHLVVSVPSGATTGTIAVTSPNGSDSSATYFVVTSSSAPTITSFSRRQRSPVTPSRSPGRTSKPRRPRKIRPNSTAAIHRPRVQRQRP